MLFAFISLFVLISASSSSEIKFSKSSFKIDGKTITFPLKVYNFTEVWGTADRIREGYNRTHTYDQLGVVLFETYQDKKPSSTVSEIQFYFKVATSNNVTPLQVRTQPVVIDKAKFDFNSSASYMLKKLKKWKQTDSYMEHSYRMSNGVTYIYFQFNESDSKLEKISIGPDKKGS